MNKPPSNPADSFLERAIRYVSPDLAARRTVARVRNEYARKMESRSYEAAGSGRRFDGLKHASNASAVTEISWALPIVRDRHRQLVRDNPWCASAVRAVKSLTVGYGIHAEFKLRSTKKQWQSGTDRFERWFGSLECDANGKLDGYGLTALIMGTVAESGECLIRRRYRRSADGLFVPMQLQVMEGDYLDHDRNEFLPNASGARIINGVQYSPIGRIEGYWLFNEHPGDFLTTSARGVFSQFVPAADVIHVFRVDRPGQVRGMPWGASVMLTILDLDGYEDAYLFRNRLANCYAAFISPGLDSGYKAQASDLTRVPTTFEPGMIEVVPIGSTIAHSTPPKADDYGGYTSQVNYRIAAGYGISHATLTGQLSEVNFTSGRMGWIDQNRNVDQWRWHMLIPQALDPIARWFFEADELGNAQPMPDYFSEWSPPKRELLDPSRETNAALRGIAGGLSSLTEWHRERGMQVGRIFQELEDERTAARDRGLILTTDAANSIQQEPEREPTGSNVE